MVTANETWKPVVGYEHKYQVSDLGRVRSTNHWDGRRNVTGKVLSPGMRPSGHTTVSLGKGNSQSVHVIVMRAFVGPPPEKHEVLHKNHIPWDNRACNLKYGTRGENLKMDYALGVRTTPQQWINSLNGRRKDI